MIINFSIENWMSFKEPASFSTVATPKGKHVERLPEIPKYKMKILPVAVIYGEMLRGKQISLRL